jgi:DMSO/TMAO reductase YedYZ heme-binding membrane subunit
MIDPAWAETLSQGFPLAEVLGSGAAYFYGFLALFMTLPLLLTSNNIAQKYLGRGWKGLHRLVYLVFVFAMLHRFLQRGDITSLAQAGLLIGSYAVLKLYAWKPFWPWANGTIQKIGALYQAFSLEKKEKIGYNG